MPTETITLGGGCFWCLEALFQQLSGVSSVIPGYSGGKLDNPDYKSVCSGKTGHAEVIQIEFDNSQISLKNLLTVFFHVHDPTTLNRQGADTGTQYRSAIFYEDPTQESIARQLISQINTEKLWPDPVVTEVKTLSQFYPAETYHHNYFQENPMQGYCLAVIQPKILKLKKQHANLVKT